MFKRGIFLFGLFLIIWAPIEAFAFSNCPNQLKRPVQTLYRLPEFSELIAKVEKEGPIYLQFERAAPNANFDGFWEATNRTISINANNWRSEGSTIVTILFELHNAKSNRHFMHLVQLAESGRISKDAYVEAVERMEYDNCLQTIALLEKGIKMGIFPKDARWYIPPTFEEHFRVQKMSGHSQWIAWAYDHMRPKARRQI